MTNRHNLSGLLICMVGTCHQKATSVQLQENLIRHEKEISLYMRKFSLQKIFDHLNVMDALIVLPNLAA